MKIFTPIIVSSFVSSAHTAFTTSEIGSGYGPIGHSDVFKSRAASPNATGSTYPDGVDVISTNPSNIISSPWLLQMNVSEISGTDLGLLSNETVTNSVLQISYPALNTTSTAVNSSAWAVCALIVEGLAINSTTAGQNDTGQCTETLGDSCVQDLESAFIQAYNTSGSNDCKAMTIPTIPSSCDGSLGRDYHTQLSLLR
jgi:hypothetical protein